MTKDQKFLSFLFSYEVEDEGRPVPAPTIPFPFLFSYELEDEGRYEAEEFKERRPQPALTIPFPVNQFTNKLAPKVPNNILINPPFCSFVSFLIVLVVLSPSVDIALTFLIVLIYEISNIIFARYICLF